jgi:DNA-binding SARP family transcriptional activator
LAAAEAVCAGDAFPAADVLAHLCSLVDRSLVVAEALGGSTRYRLLETVRQYGTERLDAAGQADDVRRRHAEYFATTVASAETGRYGLSRDALAESLRPELDNVRAALWWSGEHDQDLFVRLVFGFGWCYFVFGLWWEGRRNFERALELPRGRRRDVARARALNDLAYMASYQYELERARVALEEAVSICEELGEERERAHAIQTLAQTYNFIGTPEALDTALRLAEEAGRVLRAAEDWMGACWASCSLGTIHGARGDGARALAAYDEGRRLAAKANQPMSVAIGCMGMASILVLQGELPRAAGLLREALAAHRKAPEFMFLAWTVEATAMLAAARGQLADAIRLLGADQTLRRQAGAVISIETAYPQIYAQIVGGARQALGDAAFEATLDEGRRLDVEGTISLAESVAVPEVSGASAVNAGATVQSSARALRVVSLGAVRVERNGTPVPLAEWKYAKARELLFLLLIHPQGRTREQIGLALWPDASTEQLRSNLHPVLHHLRRVLGGPEWIVHEGGVYRFDRSRDYVFDAEEMERLVASVAPVKGDEASVADALSKATALYGGDFLEQDPPAGDWHIERQDALRRLYETALESLGKATMALERWAEAADAWRRLIARDPLNEVAYRKLMRCHERLGERREAVRLYERLTTVLRDELDSEPEPETQRLFERIQGGVVV